MKGFSPSMLDQTKQRTAESVSECSSWNQSMISLDSHCLLPLRGVHLGIHPVSPPFLPMVRERGEAWGGPKGIVELESEAPAMAGRPEWISRDLNWPAEIFSYRQRGVCLRG